jgi:DNA-binding GntR family transcriptional regulator
MGSQRAETAPKPRLHGHVERPRSLREQIHERLRAAILSGELPAGAPVIEAEIAAQLGASRTPVRDARLMTARDAAGLERLVERMRKRPDDVDAMEKLDTEFHDRILALADGQRLKRMLGDLRADILPWRIVALSTAARRRAVIEEHAAIVAALVTKDEEAITAAMTRHIRNTQEGVLAQGAA